MKTKKNKGIVPKLYDTRIQYVSIGCGECIECRKKKSREWQIRLNEELKHNPEWTFVTLTFSNESLEKCYAEILKSNKYQISSDFNQNDIATWAVRHFLERWRKKYKKSLKHWLITELGHKNTERIHLHGLLNTKNTDEITKIWQYGWVYNGKYVNEKTINYIIKYVTKLDKDHKWFKAKILTSPGLGSGYEKSYNAKGNRYNEVIGEQTNELYKTKNGLKLPLPIYYRNKIYTEDEREQLWIEKLDQQIRYIRGIKIDISTPEGEEEYNKLLKQHQFINKTLGYSDGKDWNSKLYHRTKKRLNNATKKKKNS